MKTRNLLTTCLVLIILSIFVMPETTWFGIDKGLAADLSTIMLMGGITSAVLTVNADANDKSSTGRSLAKSIEADIDDEL
jgi:hypothetical protein